MAPWSKTAAKQHSMFRKESICQLAISNELDDACLGDPGTFCYDKAKVPNLLSSQLVVTVTASWQQQSSLSASSPRDVVVWSRPDGDCCLIDAHSFIFANHRLMEEQPDLPPEFSERCTQDG